MLRQPPSAVKTCLLARLRALLLRLLAFWMRRWVLWMRLRARRRLSARRLRPRTLLLRPLALLMRRCMNVRLQMNGCVHPRRRLNMMRDQGKSCCGTQEEGATQLASDA